MVLGSEPGFVDAVIIPFRETATVLLFAGVVAVLAARIRKGHAADAHHARARPRGRDPARACHDRGHRGPACLPGRAEEVLAWVIALSFAGVAVGFMAGLWAWRLFENRALRRLAAGLAAHPPALSLSETAELCQSRWIDRWRSSTGHGTSRTAGSTCRGSPSSLASSGGARCVTEISGDDGRVVAVVHDPALRDDPTFLDVARASVLKALELERLSAELRSSLRELNESRARIMSGADRERQRIERDLHDGAQQSLVALRIRLELAGELLRESPAGAEQLLGKLSTEVDDALEQVRSLARGVYPSLLSDRGLGEALRSAALRSPVRITVDADGIGRHSPMVEAAVYFCCLEAIQNAMKHAGGVGTISVSSGRERGSPLRGERRRGRVREGRGDVERRPHQHERSARGCRRRARDPNGARQGDLCLRNGSAEHNGSERLDRRRRRLPEERGAGGADSDRFGHTPGVDRGAALSSSPKTTMPYTTYTHRAKTPSDHHGLFPPIENRAPSAPRLPAMIPITRP